ncbi:hypothetical protein PGH12_06940 [Chryseobacterium wangxinyae]|uniref:hypothetical protein n=1 Tax=Chryseobacterium sp. CY350 TaxID=2997336 RepID=UPI0022714828|nr:hypothetical protein [Chryseobacterium sp. CY350]MCY0976887.1 hypothetical protein [Chryseobacterium sp. CY350]WBZ96886.1 hypothetical protein PGH12_06940 [Chryseobacterium sp. CY350]
MFKKTIKELLLQDLIETKQMLIDAFDDKDVPFIKGGAIDQFFTSKALEFQRNVIFYNSISSGSLEENEENKSEISPPVEKIANDLTDIK